ncbi:hypothetical protein FHW69_000700 [Luteibacter sp. Sphag1AF]|uniref:GFA family protein n=1 Tax=Luteibacter sp. Sphag1AF TaxID=2587031 RepID=UPI00161C1A2E|nr:GFA family protein [Luteibacter sp. Sphag1AF]MBB3226110.1 hypothetical protein [Luteibacter sp. Sphag1AF]
MSTPLTANCFCGAVRIELTGEPVARANCHCGSCRDFYGTSMLSATAWPEQQVNVTEGATTRFPHPTKQLAQTFCVACGETVFGENRLNMRIVPNSLLARSTDGVLAADMQPTMHLYYRNRIIDVVDDLPKYLDGWDGPLHEG